MGGERGDQSAWEEWEMSANCKYEWVSLGGFEVIEVGPPSRRRKICGIVEHVFTSERDAKDAAKAGGGTWVKRRRHATRKVEMTQAKEVLAMVTP